MKSVQIRNFFLVRIFPAFGLNTEIYEVSLRIQSECGKIQTRKNSIFEHILHSVTQAKLFNSSTKIHLQIKSIYLTKTQKSRSQNNTNLSLSLTLSLLHSYGPPDLYLHRPAAYCGLRASLICAKNSISYRNQSFDLPCESIDWFLYEIQH